MRGVLHHGDSPPVESIDQTLDLHWAPSEVNRDHRFRARSYGSESDLRRQIEGLRVDIHDDRMRAEVDGHVCRGSEGPGRNDHLVAWPDAERLERQVEPGGRGVDRHRMMRAHEPGKARLELADFRPGGQPAGVQNREDSRSLGVGDRRPGKRQERSLRSHGRQS